ncbi:MADS-box transcription factor PHERES 2 [Linum perenne]
MGRTKVQHELISNEISRKITFKKRKIGLLKKLKEIMTLCGVIACGIIFHNFNRKVKKTSQTFVHLCWKQTMC